MALGEVSTFAEIAATGRSLGMFCAREILNLRRAVVAGPASAIGRRVELPMRGECIDETAGLNVGARDDVVVGEGGSKSIGSYKLEVVEPTYRSSALTGARALSRDVYKIHETSEV